MIASRMRRGLFRHPASHWPNPQQELCLRAALLPGEAGFGAWRQARAAAEPDRMDAGSQSLLPLVYRNLAGRGADDKLSADLKDRYIATWGQNQRIYHAVLPLLQGLEGAGIDAVVLKGLALVARFYRDPGLRPMADVDVLVPARDAARAGAVAESLGLRLIDTLTT